MRALGYLLASLLGASRFSLSVDAVTALVEDCAASSEEATAERALACMVALVQHVPRDALSGLISARAASHILSNRQGNLAHNLQSLQSRHGEADVEPFVTAVLSKAVLTAASDPEASSKQLLNLVESGVQGVAGHVTKLLGSLSLEYLKLSEGSTDQAKPPSGGRNAAKKFLVEMARILSLRYPDDFGKAIEALMSGDEGGDASANVYDFVSSALAPGSLHQPLKDDSTGTTLFLALQSPSKALRKRHCSSLAMLMTNLHFKLSLKGSLETLIQRLCASLRR